MQTIIRRRAKNLIQEKDDGYIEYKWKLTNISYKKKQKIITQMNYRLNEGNGRTMYAIGFMDNGEAKGITKEEFQETMDNIHYAVNYLKVVICKILIFEDTLFWAKVFIRDDKHR
jgi:GTPase